MGNIYIARQPIFDKKMKIYGYELLYRQSENNYFEGTDDDQATASLLDNFFLTEFNDLIEGTRGFINFSRKLLIDQVPLLLDPNKVVIEILERVEITEDVVEECKKLKEKGYTIALDDFIFEDYNKRYGDILEYIDIIKVEFFKETLDAQKLLIKKYKHRITFLAERVETREDYHRAKHMGYSLFQGYFFSKPLMINSKAIGSISSNLTIILDEINKADPNIKSIAAVFERDLDLSYKLLRMVNSAYYGTRYKIESIHHALVTLGTIEIGSWVNVMIVKGIQNIENAEIIKTSLIRGKVLALLSLELTDRRSESDYFITGIFSSIDILLNQDMKTIVSKLPIADIICQTLLGEDTIISSALEAMLSFEKSEWEVMDNYLDKVAITKERFMEIYVESVKWQQTL